MSLHTGSQEVKNSPPLVWSTAGVYLSVAVARTVAELKCLRSLGVERISFCCPPIFDCSAPAHERDGAAPIIPLPMHPLPSAACSQSRWGIPGGHQWSVCGGESAGSWVAPCAQAPEGGDNVLLIDWASWAECRNLAEGEVWGVRGLELGQNDEELVWSRLIDLCGWYMFVWFTLLPGRARGSNVRPGLG